MNHLREMLKVYFILGSTNCFKDPREVLAEAIDGGITMFQFREKGDGALTGVEKFNLAKDLQSLCRKKQIPFIVNDDIELALALDADGVHIGQEDEPASVVREKIGNKILGVSVHSMEEALAALKDGADYFGIGPVFPTKTKKDAKPTRGTTLIEELRRKGYSTPIVGIGGITTENASTVMAAGADGISVISAISHASSPYEAAKILRKRVESGEKGI
ncbi:thiamine phosphate synthase [Neobacillus thermocopriae]|uniref:Thiamine-phosphate synthase n=1 Tax=Neobacillus thermocopriae TaxID=1215031 RepID=A0A6B3TM94_9BACI|nr:thiamine phosphate synthase [Neobacillus thermocopriae]MED3623960.1 thiamine phosphate synthase [Neobacillus thermocopriae]MED3713845.1 thiamine phosphate synthase [Neobacillus thermocopriae]NEX78013.1 thiamine phosphate synthase [Neobacillus thermocopriae]